jgi:hypothetical protein
MESMTLGARQAEELIPASELPLNNMSLCHVGKKRKAHVALPSAYPKQGRLQVGYA